MGRYIPSFGKVVVVREDFMRLCEGKRDSAVLLSILTYWTEIKLGMFNQVTHENEAREKDGLPPIDIDDLWVWKSYEELLEESLGLLTEYSLKKAIAHLKELGLLEVRKNPRYRWDRTNQYRLNLDVLIRKLKEIHQTLETHHSVISTDRRGEFNLLKMLLTGFLLLANS